MMGLCVRQKVAAFFGPMWESHQRENDRSSSGAGYVLDTAAGSFVLKKIDLKWPLKT